MNGYMRKSVYISRIAYFSNFIATSAKQSSFVCCIGRPMSTYLADEKNKHMRMSSLRSSSLTLPSTQVYIQVISSGCYDQGKCVFLFTENNRYMFNCPEDVSRIVRFLGNFRINRLQDVFFTRNTWANIGGLPGLSLALKQAYVKEVTVHGPTSIDSVFRATNCMYDGSPPVKIIQKHHSLGNFEDNSLSIKYVPLFGRRKSGKTSTKAAKNEETHDLSVAYICQLKQRPGRMNVAECVRLNIPFGPLLGQLQKGLEVTLPDGRVIKPEQVLHPPDPCTTFALVDVEDDHHLASLLQSEQFQHYFQSKDQPGAKLELLIHYTNAKIFESESYQMWMKKFGAETQHLVLNELAPAVYYNAGVFSQQAQLNHMNSDIYKLLSCHKNHLSSIDSPLDAPVVMAEPHLTYHLRPLNKFARSDPAESMQDINTYVKQLYDEEEEFKSVFDFYRERKSEYESDNVDTPKSQYPEVIFLGTSSAVQTKYRAVSSILVHLSAYRSILMDCGEGTLSQLNQYYDVDELPRILTNIKLVFISHLHADHHLGLFTLLQKRKDAFEKLDLNFEPVHLIAPAELFKVQLIYSQLIDDIMPLAKRLPSNGENELTLSGLAEIKRRLNLSSIRLVKVSHPKSAFGLVFRMANGYKVVYSGDTIECPRLIEQGRNADLLIHEATLDDSRQADAKIKYHCTMSQAYDVSKKMNAKFTIFTHFSGRYTQLPIFDDDMLKDKNVFFAFDFTRFQPCLTNSMATLIPVLKVAFNRHYEEALIKKENYECRLIRQRDEKIREMKLKQNFVLNS